MDIQNSIVFESIQSLSAWEAKSFGRWLASPFFNAKPSLPPLFNYLHRCHAAGHVPDPEDAFKAAFPDKKMFDDQKLQYACSWLQSQLRQFFAWQEMQAEPLRAEIYAVRNARKRGLEKQFRQAWREAEQALKKGPEHGMDTHLAGFQLFFEKYQWELARKRGHEMPFGPLLTHLSAFSSARAFQLGCMVRAQEAILRQSLTIAPQLDRLLSGVPDTAVAALPEVALYHVGYRMLEQPEESRWSEQFRDLLRQHSGHFPLQEARDLLMLAINHCIRRINRGDTASLPEILGFYELGLEKKLLHDERGFLSKYTYNNILMAILALEDWPRAENFLEAYKDQLPAAERDHIYAYNLAIFHFRQGAYDQAQELLRSLNMSDAMYNLEVRKMLLKIYYEQNAFDALESLLENLLTWLRRHGEIGYHREMYRNLARFTGKLLSLPPSDREKREKLAKKIRDTPLVAERSWLLSKI
ncbi:MAG: hypothetical protein R2791_06830 [Saprospiraceae bacterium]|nr:hypothetical protein [Saprospiraceae bacterium]MCB9356668.1 hypothetical protein [Lewinellaceae bacterium]